MEDLLNLGLTIANNLGADYAESRFQSDTHETLLLKNGAPEVASNVRRVGVSIRVLLKGSMGFASTNILTRDSVKEAARRAVKLAKAVKDELNPEIRMSEEKLERERVEVKPKIKHEDIDLESKFKELIEADKLGVSEAEKSGAKLPSRMLSLDLSYSTKLVINSDGAQVFSAMPKTSFYALLTAYHPQKIPVQRYVSLGETRGWEAIKEWDIPKLLGDESSILSKIILEAVDPPSGTLDLILGPEVVGIVCHESSGHPAEADRILGREAAQAGETYLKRDSIGLRVGSDKITVIDDPTIPGSFGFYLYDDEGVKARKRYLIKEGIINEFLHNRETAVQFGTKSNASSRSSAFNREPIVRMANTYVAPGDYSLDELIEDVKLGIYIKSFMEWNIDDRRFNQKYVGLEAYKIENGKLGNLVRNPVVEMTTIGLWSSVDAVGKDLEFQSAFCGKGDPMQGIPVWTGGPHIRLRRVKV